MKHYCYLLTQSSKFCSRNSLHCFSVGAFVVCVKCNPWSYNGWFGGKLHLYGVLLHTLEKCNRNDQRNFGYNDMDRTQISESFSLFKHVETWAEDFCVLRSKTRSMLMTVLELDHSSSETCSTCSSTTNSITRRFCNISVSTSATNIRNYSRIRTGWLTMIMCQHTMLCHCRSFWPQRAWLWSLSLLTHTTKCWSDHIRTLPTTVESHIELWSMWQG